MFEDYLLSKMQLVLVVFKFIIYMNRNHAIDFLWILVDMWMFWLTLMTIKMIPSMTLNIYILYIFGKVLPFNQGLLTLSQKHLSTAHWRHLVMGYLTELCKFVFFSFRFYLLFSAYAVKCIDQWKASNWLKKLNQEVKINGRAQFDNLISRLKTMK